MLKNGVPEVHQCFLFLHPQPLHDVNNEVVDYEIYIYIFLYMDTGISHPGTTSLQYTPDTFVVHSG